jgi:hypothetical protein
MRKTDYLKLFATPCALRAPTSFVIRIYIIRITNEVRRNSKSKNGFPKDRRLRADGFIIRA